MKADIDRVGSIGFSTEESEFLVNDNRVSGTEDGKWQQYMAG
jgi:hypothetical protein